MSRQFELNGALYIDSKLTRRGLLITMLGGCMESSAKAVPLPKTIEVDWDGLTFPVVTWGAPGARPILLLHGFPQEPATWAPIAEALAQYGCQAFAPVQRGYAASTRPKGPGHYTFAKFVADAVGIDRKSVV